MSNTPPDLESSAEEELTDNGERNSHETSKFAFSMVGLACYLGLYIFLVVMAVDVLYQLSKDGSDFLVRQMKSVLAYLCFGIALIPLSGVYTTIKWREQRRSPSTLDDESRKRSLSSRLQMIGNAIAVPGLVWMAISMGFCWAVRGNASNDNYKGVALKSSILAGFLTTLLSLHLLVGAAALMRVLWKRHGWKSLGLIFKYHVLVLSPALTLIVESYFLYFAKSRLQPYVQEHGTRVSQEGVQHITLYMMFDVITAGIGLLGLLCRCSDDRDPDSVFSPLVAVGIAAIPRPALIVLSCFIVSTPWALWHEFEELGLTELATHCEAIAIWLLLQCSIAGIIILVFLMGLTYLIVSGIVEERKNSKLWPEL
ncbi:hypothetical protein SCAR479_13229 [Seiridium cardinale]|uniref:Uncharacterized protein n=1 Tax=Seiridium cardinale TaxID=138064 RepID=A0ABR2X8L4_9PEZI